jgi:hypothetical protein
VSGTSLLILFHPHTNAKFYLEESDPINGHGTVRVSYQVPKELQNIISITASERLLPPIVDVVGLIGSFHVVRLERNPLISPQTSPSRGREPLIMNFRISEGKSIGCLFGLKFARRRGHQSCSNVIEFKKVPEVRSQVDAPE